MAGMTGQCLRLTTSRKPAYRRGGVKIGTASAPTLIEWGEFAPDQVLAIIRDPNITMALETEDGEVRALTPEELAEIESGLLLGVKLDADLQPEIEPEPTAQTDPAAPEPEPEPKPISPSSGKKAKVAAA